MLSFTIIMGLISGYSMFAGLVMANAVDPDLEMPSLHQFVSPTESRK